MIQFKGSSLKVSPPRSSNTYTPWLFPELLGNHGHRRTVIGEFIEQLTVKFFNGQRHKCHGADYCPDVSVGDLFLECKAMGATNQTLIYEGRLHKDIEFARDHQLFYVVWKHNVDTLKYHTVVGLKMALLQHLEYCAVVPFAVLERFCLWATPTKLNSAYGKKANTPQCNKVYGSGYRIPGRIIEPWKLFSCE